MTALDPNRLLDSTARGLAADSRSLDSLRRAAARDPQAALKGAAQQFEALFLQMVLKSMRDAVPKSGLLDSAGEQTYTGLLDQQLVSKVAASGTGLAGVIARQLARHLAPEARGGKETTQAPGADPPALAPRAATDRYAQIARANPESGVREAELARTNPAARAAYLARRDAPAAVEPGEVAQAPEAAAVAEAATARSGSALGAEQRHFVTRMWDHAAAAQQATGIPARFILAQAALESGWGRQEIRGPAGQPSHNLFGIKAGSGWTGRTVDVATTEYEDGVAKKAVGKFRAYNNYTEAFRDWARLIATNPRYAQVVEAGRGGGNAAGFAHGLARAGYATDPDYGAKLARVIGSLAQVRGADGRG
jgi:flagellar protein FlgJ